MNHLYETKNEPFPFNVAERFKIVVLIVCWFITWTGLIVGVDDFLRALSLKWDPIDMMFAVLLLVIGGPIPPLAVWLSSIALLVNQDSMQISKIFGLSRRKYTIGEITDVQIFGTSKVEHTTKKVQPRISISFSDGNTIHFTAAATNFDRLLRYLESKATRILKS